ncbi:MAG: NADH-quinone oxidoreductase subunit L [Dehalococcoidia bacterium]|nr:NADH-quinone oxidoreductase subunit L [Dehalococcoidia bacterium]
MDDTGIVIAFWVLTLATLGSALLVVTVDNIFHAVLSLIVSFIGVAGLYILLSADFIAVAQVLVYAGALSVLMLFALMLTPRQARNNAGNSLQVPVLMLAGIVGGLIAMVALATDWRTVEGDRFQTTSEAIGEALIDKWVLPFEIAAVLLLVAMVGAIILVREDR